MKTTFSFTGEVIELSCQCHKGQALLLVYMVSSGNGERACVAEYPYPNAKSARIDLDSVTMATAAHILKENGLDINDAEGVRVVYDEDATKAEAEYMRGIDTTLH